MGEQEKDFLLDFSRQIGELCADIRNVMKRMEKGDAKMADHEARLANLELCKQRSAPAPEPLKDWLLKALVRIVGWGMVIIGALSGAGEILQKLSLH